MTTKPGTDGPSGPAAGAPDKPAPIFLRAADVKAKAREAFLRGELQAQTKRGDGPRYSGPCAIGVSLTDEQRARLDRPVGNVRSYTITGYCQDGVVESDDPSFLRELQNAHDALFWSARMGTDADVAWMTGRLRSVLDIPPADQGGPTGSPKGVAPDSEGGEK